MFKRFKWEAAIIASNTVKWIKRRKKYWLYQLISQIKIDKYLIEKVFTYFIFKIK